MPPTHNYVCRLRIIKTRTERGRPGTEATVTVYCMMHQALDHSDQTRKYGISESIIQALIMQIMSACIMDQR